MSRWLKCTSTYINTDWNKYDDRLMKAVERSEVDKVAAVLSKKGVIPTKLDVEGRSAFHLAATRGHLDCLSLILGHQVDITAKDATGKNALHLACKNAQSLCVQKLLQHNCPVGNVDLHGRTALHDAVIAGCTSSVKLLCDSGASVNASDFDGRTPLVLATQMCHARICQLLLERGADIAVRDKQNKTALILGCEYACKDAVEVLLKNGADVMAIDGLGHDSYHYARLSKNHELVSLVKTYLDSANRVKEVAKLEQKKRQDLEKKNETQQETLRRFHQEQRALLDKVNILQQKLTQEQLTVEDIHKEREQLKLLLSAKERDEGARVPETVKVQLRSTMGDYSGQSVIKAGKESLLVKHSQSLDSAQVLQPPALSRSLSRPLEVGQPVVSWDPAAESEALRRELDMVRKQQQTAEEDSARLQSVLARKSQECQEMAQSREAIQRQADQQVQELEEALGDVQKRMLDSESKVKQLQAHVVAVKEHLEGQAAEELRVQLQEVKTKYEGASAEVGRVRNRLKQSEKALEEYKSSEGQLAVEAERLGQELGALKDERDTLAQALLEMETHRKEAQAHGGATVPAEKFDNMKNLLTNAVDEKERQLAELREDYDRVLEEVAELHRDLDNRSTQGGRATVPMEEHQRVRAALEEQSASLKRRLADVTAKSQALIGEVEESEEERDILREQLDELHSRMEADYVPREDHEEAHGAIVKAMEELEDKLVEASERYGKAEAQVQQLQTERASLLEKAGRLESSQVESQRHQMEMKALLARNSEQGTDVEALLKRCEELERELVQATAQRETLRQSLEREYVPRVEHEQVKAETSAALKKAQADIAKLENERSENREELTKVNEGSAKLKEKLEKVQLQIEKDYVSLKDHEAIKSKLSALIVEAENRAQEAATMYESSHVETEKLTHEMEAQRKELDTIHEAIQSKFIPLTAIEEKENCYNAKLKDLTLQLSEVQEKYDREKSERERHQQEKEQLSVQMESVQQRLETGLLSREQHKETEERHKGSMEALTLKLVDLEQHYKEVTVQRAELEEQNALCNNEILSLQQRLESKTLQLEQCEAQRQALQDALQLAQQEGERARETQRGEAQRACALEKELRGRTEDQASLLQQHAQAQEALQAEVATLRLALREEEESSAQRAEDVSALQSELLHATQALEDLRDKDDQMSQLAAVKRRLEEEVVELGDKLTALAEECEQLQLEAGQAREREGQARTETGTLQQKSEAIEREIRELKERYDKSLSTIGDLQRRIQTSAEQTEVKDLKITELLLDVERLKQALNGLSQLAYAGNAPKRQTQHIDTLQAQIKSLQQQLADAERQHREVVSIYRTHLLSAAQGHMDEDVQAALLQIIRMRQEFVC